MKIIASGNTADIIELNENQVCKLFHSEYPEIYVQHEFDNASIVYQAGILTPKAYGIINIDGRDGIIYDKVVGDTLFQKMNYDDKKELSLWMDRFVTMHQKLIEHYIDCLMDYKDFLKLFSKGSSALVAQIDCLEDGNCLLHGDFHPANIMVNTGNQLVLIDMMNVCRGPAIYDVARTYFLLEGNKTFQARYLELMGYKKKDIIPYLRVISRIREREANT